MRKQFLVMLALMLVTGFFIHPAMAEEDNASMAEAMSEAAEGLDQLGQEADDAMDASEVASEEVEVVTEELDAASEVMESDEKKDEKAAPTQLTKVVPEPIEEEEALKETTVS